ncbi:MAG: threonine--tRNA ligase [Flavobacteriaceae bacterium]|nr:threonine--tRNA ligase [Flavobacteriaceae bacterium]MCY4268379.1 threonine--tRNA ligase [Flavobacteriaceae bacterium]MCY4298384.1 threonine--tRNA ligase [Flavobacteriaceae bacterium]
MITIAFPSGEKKTFEKGISAHDIAFSISRGLGQTALSARFNNQIIELSQSIETDGAIEFYTWSDSEGKKAFWHSSAHVLAQVLVELYPDCHLTIGPPIDQGFYYDVSFNGNAPSARDFQTIENRFKEHARKKYPFLMRSVSKEDALDYYKKEKNPYKVELIENLTDGDITFCDHADFTDLCRGGHIPNTGYIKAIKLLNISGAFWRANQSNAQLTRIYGISFPKQKYLNEYLQMIQEAKKRDHRVIGKQLGLFTFSNHVGAGLPLWLPDGAALRQRLEEFMRDAQKRAGYDFVITPHIGAKQLYVTSGHFEKYSADNFGPIKTPDQTEEFLLKSMNCPHHCEIYNSQQWSYKNLPVRYSEFGTVYRYEQSGELHGLTRVRGFTQDDAHIFCTPEQLNQEFKKVIDLVLYVFESLSFKEFTAQVSLKDPKTPEKYLGDEKQWEKAQNAIIKATKEKGLDYTIEVGEAAFYGPKLDFMVKDTLQRKWQLGTIQVDYNLPERFDLVYKGKDDKLHRPIMIHRAPFGSLERFVAILIEHTAGEFPLWLTPHQVKILCVGESHHQYAQKVAQSLENSDIRTRIDMRNQTVGKKIRDAEISKTPYMLLIGDQEIETKTLSVRKHKEGDIGSMSLNQFISEVKQKVKEEVSSFENNHLKQ